MGKVLQIGLLVGLVLLALSACSRSIPACDHAYTKQGDSQAARDLYADLKRTIPEVQKHHNAMLLSQVRSIVQSRNFIEMEDWVCRAQTQYGLPSK